MIFNKELKKQLASYKKKLIQDYKNKKTLISKDTDWALLEQLIQAINSNPNLRIDVNLKDGTVLHLKTYTEPKVDLYTEEYINVG